MYFRHLEVQLRVGWNRAAARLVGRMCKSSVYTTALLSVIAFVYRCCGEDTARVVARKNQRHRRCSEGEASLYHDSCPCCSGFPVAITDEDARHGHIHIFTYSHVNILTC